MTSTYDAATSPTRPVPIMLNGGRVSAGFRDAVFDAADREGKSVNEIVLEAAGRGLKAAGYDFPAVFPPHSSAKRRGLKHGH